MHDALLSGLFAVLVISQCQGSITVNEKHSPAPSLGTFQDPSQHVRPKFRYWVPDASVDLSRVRADIEDAANIGIGGLQLLGYYNYGDIEGGPGIIPTDWTKYGWGTQAWRDLQDVALNAIADNDMIIDLTLGPNQGAGVPSTFDADGLQWDLQPFNVSVPVGGTFKGTLPGWGIGSLVSASTGLVINNASNTNPILAAKSLQDVSDKVSRDGKLDISFPSDVRGSHFVLFAYYLVHSDYREQQTPTLVTSGDGIHQSPVEYFVQNGSWLVDHYSSKGAAAVAKFWNEYLLNGSTTSQLVRQVGHYMWEDSQEYPANVLWTPGLPSAFEKDHGYSVNKWIPILMHGNNGVTLFGPSVSESYITDEADNGTSHISDYRQTLTDLNAEYLDGLTLFAQSIGTQSSAQVVYNLPMDMLANVVHVNAPECESLAFFDNVDGYRQYSGPADLAGKSVISSECGANYMQAYQLFIPHLLYQVKRSIAGGVNTFVFHGMPFSGYYPNTTWPSWVTFQYTFSEMHNRHQPGWDFYGDFIDYTARLQYVTQLGVPKVDVAFWLKSISAYVTPSTSYQPTDLEQAGYTYEYLSPDDFDLPVAVVQDRILAPSAQSFKSLVVRATDLLTPPGVSKLAEWAARGLPIFFYGGIPSAFSGTVSEAEERHANATLSHLQSLGNVHVVPTGTLASSLAAHNILPRAAISLQGSSTGTLWYTRWRETTDESVVFVYYAGNGGYPNVPQSNGSITFASTGVPYLYDAWTGSQTRLLHYTQTEDATQIPLSLAGDQTVVIAFKKGTRAPTPSIEQMTATVEIHDSVLAESSGELTVSCQGNSSEPIRLSNNSSIAVPCHTIASSTLNQWSLTIESWSAPADIFNIEGTVKQNSTYEITSLLPWNQLNTGTNLTYVAGRGYYQTNFSWPPANSTAECHMLGADLSLSPILHTAVLFVNGDRMPPLDVTAPHADISASLRKGLNTIDIIVSTPLGNALIPVVNELEDFGAPAQGVASFAEQEYGLVGEVVLSPYCGIKVRL